MAAERDLARCPLNRGTMSSRESLSGQRRASSSRRSDDSKDEEHYTGELMGKWLTDLPPTMPFHRGQVCGADESSAASSASCKPMH